MLCAAEESVECFICGFCGIFSGESRYSVEGLSAVFAEAAECHPDGDPLVVFVEGMLFFFPKADVFFEFEGGEVFFVGFFLVFRCCFSIGGFFCIWGFREGVGGAVRVDVWFFVITDDSETGDVLAGFVYGEAEGLHFFFEGVEVGLVLGVVCSCYGYDGEEASAADGESGVIDVWECGEDAFGFFDVGEVVEVEG